jgi:hypothetical protein
MHARLVLLAMLVLVTGGAQAQEAVVIPTGEVYCYGHAIEGPYRLAVENGTVTINGIRVYPALADELAPEVIVTETSVDRHALCRRVYAQQRELTKRGASLSEITHAMAAEFAADTALVSSVADIRDGSFWVWWNGENAPEEILVECLPESSPQTGTSETFELLRGVLDRGCIVIIGSRVNLYIPPNDQKQLAAVREEISRARDATSADLDAGMWDGTILPLDAAKQFQSPLPLPAEKE